MEIKEIYQDLKELGDPGTLKIFEKLMDYYINERRKMNDIAEGDDFKRNQGAIEILKEIGSFFNSLKAKK